MSVFHYHSFCLKMGVQDRDRETQIVPIVGMVQHTQNFDGQHFDALYKHSN